jgi:propionate CoA-transferase
MQLLTQAQLLARILRWRLRWDQRDLDLAPPAGLPPTFMSARAAVRLIPDRATVVSSGMAANCRCSIFYWGIREAFLNEQRPGDLTWIAVGGMGGRGRLPGTLEELAVRGLVRRVVSGHLETLKGFLRLAEEGHCELHTMTQGQMCFLLEAQGRGERSRLTRTGIGTLHDPRVGRGSVVAGPTDRNLITREGDQLRYELPPVDVALFTAPAADRHGNLYVDHACMVTESRESALAARANGGKVLVAVAELVEPDPARVFLPAEWVDAIVVNPDNEQTGGVPQRRYWEMFTEGAQVDVADAVAQLRFVNRVLGLTPLRGPVDEALARSAAQLVTELVGPGAFVNIGVGHPEEVCRLIATAGLADDITFLTETGVMGGLPTPGIYFGAAINPRRIVSSAEVFQLCYEKLDLAILGMLQADAHGNVNVSQRGDGPLNYVGPGGFIDLSTAARTVVFVGTWMTGGQMELRAGRLAIRKRGSHKFLSLVDEVTFSGAEALARDQRVFYVTNVGVFRLTPRGMELCRVFPGVDVHRDIVESCPMRVVLPLFGDPPLIDPATASGQDFQLGWANG